MIEIDSEDQFDCVMDLFKLLAQLGLKSQAETSAEFRKQYSYDFERQACCDNPRAYCCCDKFSDYDYYHDEFDDEPFPDVQNEVVTKK